jgi:esterase/lipase superfamily enzyme
MAPPNKAFKLTSASRVEALRATTRRRRSQLNAMFGRPRCLALE